MDNLRLWNTIEQVSYGNGLKLGCRGDTYLNNPCI